jgi:hypothetical protein
LAAEGVLPSHGDVAVARLRGQKEQEGQETAPPASEQQDEPDIEPDEPTPDAEPEQDEPEQDEPDKPSAPEFEVEGKASITQDGEYVTVEEFYKVVVDSVVYVYVPGDRVELEEAQARGLLKGA